MKKKLVAVVLSVTMCLATVLEAGAAAFGSPDSIDAAVQNAETDYYAEAEEEIPGEPDADIFSSGEEDSVTDVITDEIPEEVPGEEPDTSEPDDVFSAGADTDSAETLVEAGAIVVSAEDWEPAGEGYKLRRAVVPAAETATVETVEEMPDAETETGFSVAEMLTDSEEVSAADAAESTDVPTEEQTSEEKPQPEESTEAPEASAVSEYYTESDGILLISTVYKDTKHTGYYLFDENGYLVTGSKEVKTGTYGAEADTEYYFTDKANAVVYSGFEGEEINPCSSNLGQQKLNDWVWTGSEFRFYDEEGKYITVAELNKIYEQTGKYTGYFKINDEYYCLEKDGTPRTGDITITVGTSSAKYYFEPGEDGEIPGRMFHEGWRTAQGSRGERWLYYNQGVTNPANVGKLLERGTIATKLDPERKGNGTYLIDKYGYILKSTIRKAENGAYYCTNKNGVIYRDTLVKYKNYRYYFGKDGKRAEWKNVWRRCPGASNRYYYFGSVPGRVVEKRGWQKVTTDSGSFYGWFYFNTAGNHYTNKVTSAGYYFTKTGRLASGVQEVDGKRYLFEASDANTHRGKMFKNTLVYYKNRWYYASANGVLRKSGWQSYKNNWYFFDNYRAVTKKFVKKNGVNGYLDNTGKYTTGWVIVSNARNLVRYIDPKGDSFVKNGTAWVDGLLYHFDKNGYRINDVTNIYTGPYYVAVDRKNCVMTVYNSERTVPVKTIRVSVGNPWTPTPTGYFTLRRSLRWQPLMGPSWGQYGTHVSGAGQGGIFVHSVSGGHANSFSLPAGEYNKLGNPASHGCIRVCVADAKWVYDHCNGATIRIFDGTYNSNESMKGPLGRRALVPLKSPYNYDPTDPAV